MVLLRCICLLQKTKVRGSAVKKTFFLDSFFGNGASVVAEKEFIYECFHRYIYESIHDDAIFHTGQPGPAVATVFGFFVMDTGFHEPKNTAAIVSKSVYMKTFLMELLMSLPWSLNSSSISKM